MSLAGTGAVAIWHDIVPEGRDNFYAWHGIEHMPERVGIPGFVRGRRFVAVEAALEFFNLYEAADIDVLRGPDYRSRLNAPSPWTLDAVRAFRNVARSICRVALSTGGAQGGLVATLRYDLPADGEAAHVAALAATVLPELPPAGGIAAVHLLVADTQASGERTAEQKARGGANAVPGAVLVVEGWGDERPFVDRVRRALDAAVMAAAGATDLSGIDVYRHQISCEKPGAA